MYSSHGSFVFVGVRLEAIMANPSSSKNRDKLYTVVLGVVVIATLYFARTILIPIALAVLFTFILTPLVKLLERIRLGRVASALCVILLAVAALGGVGWVVTKQFAAVVEALPNYKQNIAQKIASVRGVQKQALGKASSTINELGQELASPAGESAAAAPSKKASGSQAATPARPLPVQIITPPNLPVESLQSALGLLTSMLLVIVFTIFMIIGRRDLRNRLIYLAGTARVNVMTHALDDAGERVSRYLRMQLLINTAYGIIVGVLLHFIGLPGAMLWGVIVAILRFIPYLGPPVGALMPLLLSVAIFPGWDHTLITLAFFVTIELVVSNFIEPVLYGDHTGLSPFAILLAATFWTVLWGPIGLLLSTPLTVCLVTLGRHIPRLAFLHVLLGDEPALTADTHYYQRLLAMDHEEAKEVLEARLKDSTLEQLYETVLIPSLSLVERDRRRDELDESAEQFICQSTRDVIEDLYDDVRDTERQSEALAGAKEAPSAPANAADTANASAIKIVCIPVRDELDEIVATMLAQVLERAGYQAQVIAAGAVDDLLAEASRSGTDVICLSGLSPFVISRARLLYAKLHAQFPQALIVVGLWSLSGDLKLAVRRVGIQEGDAIFTTLSQVVSFIDAAREKLPVQTSEPAAVGL
jgi:predicted PurR-regulated permease PerM